MSTFYLSGAHEGRKTRGAIDRQIARLAGRQTECLQAGAKAIEN